MVIFFINTTLRARQIFHAYSLKAFDRSASYAPQAFLRIFIEKFYSRRMNLFYEDAT